MTLTEQELRWAQKDIQEGGGRIAKACLRLEFSKYQAEADKIMNLIHELNRKLIADINKGKR